MRRAPLVREDLADESGSGAVEFAIALPFLLVTAIALIQLCLFAMSGLSLEAQVTKGTWDVSAKGLVASTDRDAVVKRAILADALLDPDKLTVTNAHVTTYARNERSQSDSAKDATLGLERGEYDHDKSLCRVEADVAYVVPSIVNVPGITDVPITRHVSHVITDTDRIEVS